MKPTFMISIDVELLWGHMPSPSKDLIAMISKAGYGREPIDSLLSIFDKYEIPATWAVVGHLFLDHCIKEDGVAHKDMPRFQQNWYEFDPCTDIKRAPLYYGKDIVEKILSTRVSHEIGYHSFSHVPFSECSREVAEVEIKEGVRLTKELGINLKSFVFPKNMIGHVDVLKEYGFEIYRGRNLRIGKDHPSLLYRVGRVAVNEALARPVEPRWKDGIWEIPSCMFFRDPLLPFSLLPRAKHGINKMIVNFSGLSPNKVFHIFLHPEDLLLDPRLLKRLDRLCTFILEKREKDMIQVNTMGELASYLNAPGRP